MNNKKYKLTFEFESGEVRDGFISWLSKTGEQNYWTVMERTLNEGDLMASFDYHKHKVYKKKIETPELIIDCPTIEVDDEA